MGDIELHRKLHDMKYIPLFEHEQWTCQIVMDCTLNGVGTALNYNCRQVFEVNDTQMGTVEGGVQMHPRLLYYRVL